MNKSMKPSKSVARQQMTPEEVKEQAMRAYVQKKASLAEAILFNMIQGEGRAMVYDFESKSSETKHLDMVKIANEMAEEFMKVVYLQEVKPIESAEE